MIYYAGIGSRLITETTSKSMTNIAYILERCGYILRSGGAKGSDKSFQRGVSSPNNKEIFRGRDAQPWSYELVKKYIPEDRPKNFDSWNPYVKSLLARNMMQILGKDGKTPVDFVVCWTPLGNYNTSEVGGTGYAIRCALDQGIPVFNLNYPDQKRLFKEKLADIIKNNTLLI